MICYVILHYQAIEETIKCIEAIKNLQEKEYKIIVVDNASPNHTGKLLKERYNIDPYVDILFEKDNLGFAKGNNIGFQSAKKYMPDYIVVLNNDVLIEQEDFVYLVREAYKKYSFDVLGPDILSEKTGLHQNPQRNSNYTLQELENYIRNVHFKNKYKFLLRIRYFLGGKSKAKLIQETDYTKVQFNVPLHGACYIFSGHFIGSHENCFYPGTFMYFESYILHYLGMREGLKFVYDPEIQVLHQEDVATDQTYTEQYQKSVFSNKCLEESGKCFKKIMMNENIKLD